ncbi:hypothetical protein [Glutamicibacter sp. AOP5-A2-18]|uniref:hypothetical protein n=1 Tax=Glutamicibacter sp. AOP5-A2-18 TaxID=3457656 RepID=UPI0040342990
MKGYGLSGNVVKWDPLIGYCPTSRRMIDLEFSHAAVSAVMTLAKAWIQAGAG